MNKDSCLRVGEAMPGMGWCSAARWRAEVRGRFTEEMGNVNISRTQHMILNVLF